MKARKRYGGLGRGDEERDSEGTIPDFTVYLSMAGENTEPNERKTTPEPSPAEEGLKLLWYTIMDMHVYYWRFSCVCYVVTCVCDGYIPTMLLLLPAGNLYAGD